MQLTTLRPHFVGEAFDHCLMGFALWAEARGPIFLKSIEGIRRCSSKVGSVSSLGFLTQIVRSVLTRLPRADLSALLPRSVIGRTASRVGSGPISLKTRGRKAS